MSVRIHIKIHIPKEKLQKLKHIAEHNAHSAHEELEAIITEHINKFEADNGAITSDNLSKLKKPKLK